MSSRRGRERRLPPMDEVWADGEADPGVFFGATDRSRKTNWKALQLCKQVERAASLALASECESDALVGAAVVSSCGCRRRWIVAEAPAAIRSWADGPLLRDVELALERLARSDDVRRIAVMPDVHLSADVCVGTVVATSRPARSNSEISTTRVDTPRIRCRGNAFWSRRARLLTNLRWLRWKR